MSHAKGSQQIVPCSFLYTRRERRTDDRIAVRLDISAIEVCAYFRGRRGYVVGAAECRSECAWRREIRAVVRHRSPGRPSDAARARHYVGARFRKDSDTDVNAIDRAPPNESSKPALRPLARSPARSGADRAARGGRKISTRFVA